MDDFYVITGQGRAHQSGTPERVWLRHLVATGHEGKGRAHRDAGAEGERPCPEVGQGVRKNPADGRAFRRKPILGEVSVDWVSRVGAGSL